MSDVNVNVDANLLVNDGTNDVNLKVSPNGSSPTGYVLPVLDLSAGSGTVALDAATLAALEEITVMVATGEVIGLDAATLAALENIVVSGTVALDAPTLAALETINAVVTGTVSVDNFPASQTVDGTVALDAATLAALESITAAVTGTVSVDNFPADYPLPTGQVTTLTPQTDALTDAELRAAAVVVDTGLTTQTDALTQSQLEASILDRSQNNDPAAIPLTATTGTLSSSGTPTLTITPAAGNAIRLWWVSAIPDPDNSDSGVVEVTLGSTSLYLASALAHRQRFDGAADETLVVTLTGSGFTHTTVHYEEFSP